MSRSSSTKEDVHTPYHVQRRDKVITFYIDSEGKSFDYPIGFRKYILNNYMDEKIWENHPLYTRKAGGKNDGDLRIVSKAASPQIYIAKRYYHELAQTNFLMSGHTIPDPLFLFFSSIYTDLYMSPCPNIASIEVYEDNKHYLWIMTPIKSGEKTLQDIVQVMREEGKFPGMECIQQIKDQLFTALKWLHSRGIVHRSLSLSEIICSFPGTQSLHEWLLNPLATPITLKLVNFELAGRWLENGEVASASRDVFPVAKVGYVGFEEISLGDRIWRRMEKAIGRGEPEGEMHQYIGKQDVKHLFGYEQDIWAAGIVIARFATTNFNFLPSYYATRDGPRMLIPSCVLKEIYKTLEMSLAQQQFDFKAQDQIVKQFTEALGKHLDTQKKYHLLGEPLFPHGWANGLGTDNAQKIIGFLGMLLRKQTNAWKMANRAKEVRFTEE